MQSESFPPPALEQRLCPLDQDRRCHPDQASSPYPRLQMMLCLALEKESQTRLLETLPMLSQDALRRDISLLSRVEARQAIALSASLETREAFEESAFFHALLSLELSAALAQRLTDCPLRRALEFFLPEYLDEVYRLANLLYLQGMESPQALACCRAEIMPGRPLAACHRHPFDCVSVPLSESDIWQDTALDLATAAEKEKLAFLLSASQHSGHPLFAELYLLSHQHLTRYLSLRPRRKPLQRLLVCQFAEAYAYDSFCWLSEDTEIQAAFQEEAAHESAHVKKLNAWIVQETGAEMALPVLPPLCLGPSKGCVRDTLQSIGVTARRSEFVPVGCLKPGADFFRYQRRVCPPGHSLPSQQVVQAVIQKYGMDYRYEIAPHPVEILRNRACDHSDLGR